MASPTRSTTLDPKTTRELRTKLAALEKTLGRRPSAQSGLLPAWQAWWAELQPPWDDYFGMLLHLGLDAPPGRELSQRHETVRLLRDMAVEDHKRLAGDGASLQRGAPGPYTPAPRGSPHAGAGHRAPPQVRVRSPQGERASLRSSGRGPPPPFASVRAGSVQNYEGPPMPAEYGAPSRLAAFDPETTSMKPGQQQRQWPCVRCEGNQILCVGDSVEGSACTPCREARVFCSHEHTIPGSDIGETKKKKGKGGALLRRIFGFGGRKPEPEHEREREVMPAREDQSYEPIPVPPPAPASIAPSVSGSARAHSISTDHAAANAGPPPRRRTLVRRGNRRGAAAEPAMAMDGSRGTSMRSGSSAVGRRDGIAETEGGRMRGPRGEGGRNVRARDGGAGDGGPGNPKGATLLQKIFRWGGTPAPPVHVNAIGFAAHTQPGPRPRAASVPATHRQPSVYGGQVTPGVGSVVGSIPRGSRRTSVAHRPAEVRGPSAKDRGHRPRGHSVDGGGRLSPHEVAQIRHRILALEDKARDTVGELTALKTYFPA